MVQTLRDGVGGTLGRGPWPCRMLVLCVAELLRFSGTAPLELACMVRSIACASAYGCTVLASGRVARVLLLSSAKRAW